MRTDPHTNFAEWTCRIPDGEVRQLLKYQVKYYFGGGLPGALPTDRLALIMKELGKDLHAQVEAGEHAGVWQLPNYAKTPCLDSLRKLLLDHLVQRPHPAFDPEKDAGRVLLTRGAQQGIYGLLDVLVNPGDYILTAAPSFPGSVAPACKLGAVANPG